VSQILIAEDEARIASFIAKGLRAAGFAPIVVGTGHEAFDLARTGEFAAPCCGAYESSASTSRSSS